MFIEKKKSSILFYLLLLIISAYGQNRKNNALSQGISNISEKSKWQKSQE